MKLLLRMIELALAGAMLGVVFYHHARFSQFAMQGATATDALHVFLLNNHGTYSYITAEQQHALQQLSYLGVALLANIILIEVILKRFFK
jgi:hypothetical protein